MQKYLTIGDFTEFGIESVLKPIVTAIPPFFSITLFMIFILGTAGSYYAILKLTGKKRFWQTLTSMSFISFLLSLLIAGMNESAFTYLSGYWVGFYIMMILISFFGLSNYK